MRHSISLTCLLFVPALFAAAPKPVPVPDAGIERYLRSEAGKVNERFLDGAKSLDEWNKRLPRLRREYLNMLGLDPLPEKTPLREKITGTVERGDVTIEKLHFQSMPGLYVTGNLYRPKEVKKPLPTVLYVCGHSGRGRDGNKTAFQDHGMWFARNGYVCLIIDTLQLGEVKGVHHGTYNLNRWWWHSLAYTPAGVECWNGIRAIDYLTSRKDVDKEKIGVTGISGGGAVTVWISAADERVKVAVPVSGMSDLKSYVNDKVVNGHCDCMFLVNLHGWEWTTIAALIAPRPMLFANSDKDGIFPMDGNRRIIAKLRSLYKLHGKPELVDEHVSAGGHDYRPDLRVAIFSFLNKHLAGKAGQVKDADDKPLPGKELRVFPEDADLPKDSINDRIDETFVKAAKVAPPAENGFVEWKKSLTKKLRETSFRAFPEKLPAAAGRGSETVTLKGGLRGHEFHAQWDVHAFLSLPVQEGKAKKGLLVVLGEGDEEKHEVPAWVKEHAKDHEVRLFLPRGTGSMSWVRKNPPNYVERASWLLGQTVDQGRVRDVAAAAKSLREEGGEWAVAGRGQAGIIAAYAALFESGISGVVAVDPPASHRQGPHFLGVLRILDVPDALGLLAPRRLTLAGKVDDAFARTAGVYAAAGAGEKLVSPVMKAAPPTKAAPPARQGWIDPAGIRGTLILAGPKALNRDLRKEFVELVGRGRAALVALGKPEELKAWQSLVEGRRTDDLARARGVVVVGEKGKKLTPDALKGCQGVLQRGGVVVVVGAAVAEAGGSLLPDAAAAVGSVAPALGVVGYEIPADTALLVRGRTVAVRGRGKLTIHLPASATRKAAKVTLEGSSVHDLTSLRRAARDRAANFPAAKPADPVVEKGALVIVGGGGIPQGLLTRFVELAGGKSAKIVVLPTAVPESNPKDGIAAAFRRLGAAKVTVLPGKALDEVESGKSLAALKEATGVWFGGGRQWRFLDVYEGTKAVPLMFDVLKRGGVIGGSSAGATIQGEYLCRGGFFNNLEITYEGYERGLGFLPGVAIDQHFAQRKRFSDMSALMKTFPQYLGIGIDETTALVVKGSVAEVVGKSKVHFYDRRKPAEKGKADHESVGNGGKYDLKERKALKGA